MRPAASTGHATPIESMTDSRSLPEIKARVRIVRVTLKQAVDDCMRARAESERILAKARAQRGWDKAGGAPIIGLDREPPTA